jgi:hypothetical protein
MLSLMLVGVASVFTINIFAEENSSLKFSPPQGFSPVAQLDLSRQEYFTASLAEFTLDEPTAVGVFVVIRNINTTYFNLSVTGPNGFNSIVMHGEGYRADQDGGLWEETLPAGTYQLLLTSHQSPGEISVSMKTLNLKGKPLTPPAQITTSRSTCNDSIPNMAHADLRPYYSSSSGSDR